MEAWAGHLLPSGSVFAFLAAHRRELFPDVLFADLFRSGRGRPSVPADVFATVIVLQSLHGLSDREAAEAVTFDLRWKAAAGLAVEAASFHATTLTYWRRRLAASEKPNRIFEVVRQVVAETGVLAGKTRRALDSTVLDDAVATQDTVTQLIAAIRRVRRDVPDAAGVIAEECSAHDYDDPGKPTIAWDDEAAHAALVNPDHHLSRWTDRHVHPGDAVGEVRPQLRRLPVPRAMHDLAIEPDTGLVTDCRLSKASGEGSGDAAVGIELLATEEAPVEVLGDSADGTGTMLAELRDSGHLSTIKPWPLRHPIPGGFTTADFTVDEIAGRVVVLHQHDALQRAHRTRFADPAVLADYRQHRPMVERSIAWLTRGNRRLRYRGTVKNNAWLHHSTAALNLRRLLALGLNRADGSWVIA